MWSHVHAHQWELDHVLHLHSPVALLEDKQVKTFKLFLSIFHFIASPKLKSVFFLSLSNRALGKNSLQHALMCNKNGDFFNEAIKKVKHKNGIWLKWSAYSSKYPNAQKFNIQSNPKPTNYINKCTFFIKQTASSIKTQSDNPKYLSEPLEMQYKHIRQRPQAELYPALLQLLAVGTAPGIIRGQLKCAHSPEGGYEE